MLNRHKITTDQLRIGMYVSELDRPWLESPFLLQGFQITDEEEIRRLQDLCCFVYVDEKKSHPGLVGPKARVAKEAGKKTAPRGSMRLYGKEASDRKPSASAATSDTAGSASGSGAERSAAQINAVRYDRDEARRKMFPGKKLQVYQDKVRWKTEIPDARRALENLSGQLKEIFTRPDKSQPLDPARLKRAVAPMIDSVIRNPDACIWLAQMKRVDSYLYEHSLASSVWAVALGRQLGLPRQDLQTLAVGGMLLDIGKLHVPIEIINSPESLSTEQMQEVREHVHHSLEELERAGFLNARIAEMVEFHHERFDGSGYPKGVAGDEIPVFARIAAIVDSYDAMTSNRAYASAMAPAVAIKELFEGKGSSFQGELVEEFIQAIGIYPAGTLVELSNGEVAIVIAEYRSRRLRPKVMVLLDANKQPMAEIQTIDLLETTTTEDGQPLDIIHGLESGAYGIDMASIEL